MSVSPFYVECHTYLRDNVLQPFYQKRLERLAELQLTNILKRKNPYLFKAKNYEIAGDLVKSIVDAYLSSQEETFFGDLMEQFAVFIAGYLYKGHKPSLHDGLKGIDLVFQRDETTFVVSIKSGIAWGNSDQINQMFRNFVNARASLRVQGVNAPIIAINGCIYGRDNKPHKTYSVQQLIDGQNREILGEYYKYAGQAFWEFLSGDPDLYREIIAPIDQEAKRKDEVFKAAYAAKINELTDKMIQDFTDSNHKIDWMRIVDFVSKR